MLNSEKQVTRDKWLENLTESLSGAEYCKYFVIAMDRNGRWSVARFDEYPNLGLLIGIQPDDVVSAKDHARNLYEMLKINPDVIVCYLAENIS